MPSVIYAAVCSDAQPDTQATAIKGMLNQLISISSSSTVALPEGFVPLPSSLATQATADISKDVVGGGSAPLSSCPGSPGSGSGGGGDSSGGSGTSTSGGSSTGAS